MATKEIEETRSMMNRSREDLLKNMPEDVYNAYRRLPESKQREYVYAHAILNATRDFRKKLLKGEE